MPTKIVLIIIRRSKELQKKKMEKQGITPEGLEVHERSQCPKFLAPGKCTKPTVTIGAGH